MITKKNHSNGDKEGGRGARAGTPPRLADRTQSPSGTHGTGTSKEKNQSPSQTGKQSPRERRRLPVQNLHQEGVPKLPLTRTRTRHPDNPQQPDKQRLRPEEALLIAAVGQLWEPGRRRWRHLEGGRGNQHAPLPPAQTF